jgi:hypothetical protein
MLFYYPLEHLSYLVSHSILPASVPSPRSLIGTSSKPVHLDVNKLGIWSTRFWAAYVALQFAHLREDAKLLGKRERAVLKAKGKGVNLEAEKAEVRRRWDALLNELVVNLGYLPLTIHWLAELNCPCLFTLELTIPYTLGPSNRASSRMMYALVYVIAPSSDQRTQIWVSLFGFIAAAASFRSGWKATALPSTPLAVPSDEKLEGVASSNSGGHADLPGFEDALAMPSLIDGGNASASTVEAAAGYSV